MYQLAIKLNNVALKKAHTLNKKVKWKTDYVLQNLLLWTKEALVGDKVTVDRLL